jgi:hypothetical protein
MAKGTAATAQQVEEIQRLRAEGVAIMDIASKVGVSRDSVMKYSSPAVETDSGRIRLLRAVAENGPTDVDELVELVPDLDKHNVTHLLYSLSKNGYVSFREVKSNGTGSHLERIYATGRGLKYIGMPLKAQAQRVGDLHSQSIRPGDGSDFRNQPSVTTGGPVTRSYTTPEPRVERKPATEPEAWPSTISNRAESVIVPEPVRYAAQIVVLPTYPTICALFERKTQLEQAATLLEQAGQVELALAALGKADEFTTLEKEAMSLYEEMSRYADR